MSSTRDRFTTALWTCIGLAACGAGVDKASPSLEQAAVPAGWVVLARTDTSRLSIDTAHLVALGNKVSVWIALDDVTPVDGAGLSSPFRHFETLQGIDCIDRQARSLQIRTPDGDGRPFSTTVRDTAWYSFEAAKLPTEFLTPVCDYLREHPVPTEAR